MVGAAVVAGEVAYAVRRPLPQFDGFDPSGTFGDPDLPPLRFAALGDSTITGPGLDGPDEVWVRHIARRLADRHRVELISLAVGGSKSRDVLEVQVPVAEDLRPDLAVVSVGGNDIMRAVPVPLFERRLDEIVARLVAVSGAVVLMGVGDLGTIPRFPAPLNHVASLSGRMADGVHARVALRHGVIKVDHWALDDPGDRWGPDMFCGDLFHPNPHGHRSWADTVFPYVERALASRQPAGSSPGSRDSRSRSGRNVRTVG